MKVSITQFGDAPPLPASVHGAVTAATGGQAGATLLTAAISVVVVAPAGTAVVLAVNGDGRREVLNRSGFDLPVYPSLATAIEGYGTNVPAVIPSGGDARFIFDGTATWRQT